MCRLNSTISKEFLLPISMPCSSAMQTYTKSGPQRGTNGHFRRRWLEDCAEVIFTLHAIFTFFMSSVTVLVWSKWTWSIFVIVFVLFVVQLSCFWFFISYSLFHAITAIVVFYVNGKISQIHVYNYCTLGSPSVQLKNRVTIVCYKWII
jgi:hypothetical protein